MPTNLALDDRLIEEAKRIGKHRSKKEAVTAALEEYVRIRKPQAILELAGTIEYFPDYNHKALRRKAKRG